MLDLRQGLQSDVRGVQERLGVQRKVIGLSVREAELYRTKHPLHRYRISSIAHNYRHCIYTRSVVELNSAFRDGHHSRDIFEGYETFTWSNGQRWMCVPEGFVFPCHDAKTMWDLWHFGDATRRIRPYKKLMKKGLSLIC